MTIAIIYLVGVVVAYVVFKPVAMLVIKEHKDIPESLYKIAWHEIKLRVILFCFLSWASFIVAIIYFIYKRLL